MSRTTLDLPALPQEVSKSSAATKIQAKILFFNIRILLSFTLNKPLTMVYLT